MTFQTLQNNDENRGKTKRANLIQEIRSTWLGRRDSNPRMPGPKPGALPLGDGPLLLGDYTTRGRAVQTRSASVFWGGGA